MAVTVEVCVGSIAEAQAAQRIGVDSIELCSWLSCGGVTPSIGLVLQVEASLRIPLRVLVRPGPGGSVHSLAEQAMMQLDMQAIVDRVPAGLVVGALEANGSIAISFMQHLRMAFPATEITFHRAIDQSHDPMSVLEHCVSLGIDRVLTSGASDTALSGARSIAGLVDLAAGRIAVAAAGGINPDNVVKLVELTGVRNVHFAAQRRTAARAGEVLMSSSTPDQDRALYADEAKMEGVLNALVKAGLR